jgi:hypothetical protein
MKKYSSIPSVVLSSPGIGDKSLEGTLSAGSYVAAAHATIEQVLNLLQGTSVPGIGDEAAEYAAAGINVRVGTVVLGILVMPAPASGVAGRGESGCRQSAKTRARQRVSEN